MWNYSSNSLRINFRKKNKIKHSDIILGFAGRYAKQKNISDKLAGELFKIWNSL